MSLKNIWKPLFWLLLGVCTWFLLKEATPKPPPFPHHDKLMHMLGFILLSYSCIKAYPSKPLWILAFMGIYGASTEVLQGILTLTRDASVWDWLADVTGILLAHQLYKISQKYGFRI